MSFQRILTFGVLIFGGCVLGHAQTATWIGNVSTGGNISIGQNWLSGNAAATDGSADILISGNVTVAPVADSHATFNSLTIDSGVPSLTISAGTGGSLVLNTSLTQKSANLQTITSPLTLGSNFSFLGAGSGNVTQLSFLGTMGAPGGFTVGDKLDLRIGWTWTAGGPVSVQHGSILELTGWPVSTPVTNDGVVVLGSGTIVDLAVGNVISGTGSVTIQGNTTFNANASYSGTTSIGSAKLTIGTDNALPTNTVVVFDSANAVLNLNNHNLEVGAISDGLASGNITLGTGRLTVDGAQAFSTYSGVISGSGSLTKSTSGTLTLGGVNTYSGGTTITGGILQIGSGGSLPAGTNLVLSAATENVAKLDLNGAPQSIGSITLTGSGTSIITLGSGLLTLGGTVTYNASGSPQGATVGLTTDTGTIDINGDRTFDVGKSLTAEGNVSSWDVSVGAALRGTGNVTKAGIGILQLEAPSTFSGATIINDGRLRLSGNGTLPTGTNVVIHGTSGPAILDLAGHSQTIGTLTFGGTTGGSQTSSVDLAMGTVTLTGDVTYDATNNPGTGEIRNGGNVSISTVRTFNVGDSANAAYDVAVRAPIMGTGGLVKTGSGTLLLAAPNTYTGGTTVSGGTLQIGDNSGGSIQGDITDNAAVVLNGGSSGMSYGGNITGSGSLTIGGSQVVTLTGNVSQTGGTTVSPGATMQMGDGTTDGRLSGNVNDSGQLWFTTAGNVSYGGVISGSGSLAKGGGAALTLSGSNTFSGETLICSGTLLLDANSALNSASFVKIDPGATLELAAGRTQTLQNIDTGSTGNIQVDSNSLLILNGGIGRSYGGPISGSGSVRFALAGRSFTYSGANTISGSTVVNGGTLYVTADGALSPYGPLVIKPVADGFAQVSIGATNQTVGGLVLGNASTPGAVAQLTINSGTVRLAGDVIFDATNNPGGGMIGGSGTLDLGSADRTFTINHSTSAQADLTVQARLAGTVALTKSGAGSLQLNAANPGLSGNVTVAQGTLVIGADNAAGTGQLTVQSGATLAGGKFNPGTSTVPTISNAVVLNDNVTLGNDSFGDGLTLSGTVSVPAAATIHLAQREPIALSGNLTGIGSAITFDGGGRLVLAGTTSGISSITSSLSAVIVTNPALLTGGSVPTFKASNGYVGIGQSGVSAAPTLASLISNIDKANFTGTVGFDTSPGADKVAPHVFGDTVDLTGFSGSVSLGSTSGAVLTGTITPAGSDYNFGNGGGVLVVQSNLTGAHGLNVTSLGSWDNALGVVLQGSNTFSGNVSVVNGGLLLDSAAALPSSARVALGANTYFSATENFSQNAGVKDLVTRLTSATGTSILGLDSRQYLADQIAHGSSNAWRTVGETIDLRPTTSVSLGTISNLDVQGEVFAPQNGVLSLISLGDGTLALDSNVTSGHASQLSLGSTNFGSDGEGRISLSGSNSYSGGTTINGGRVSLQNSSVLRNGAIVSGPLGTGAVTVASGSDSAVLLGSGVSLNNSVVLNGWLQLGDPTLVTSSVSSTDSRLTAYTARTGNDLTFNGTISGSGGLQVYGTTTLNAANTFSGGVNWNSGNITLGNNAGFGTGSVTVGALGSYNNGQQLVLNGNRTISNNVMFGNNGGFSELYFGGSGSATFTGSVNLGSGTTILIPMTDGQSVTFANGIGGNGALWIGGVGNTSMLIGGTSNSFNGLQTISGGANVDFASIASLPNSGSLQLGFGYIGLASAPGTASDLQSKFINRFVHSGWGTIGFDSPAGTTTTFSGNIDLTGFAGGISLGTRTSALLSGTITPQSNTYAFGGGGGTLTVSSNLTDSSTYGNMSLSSGALTLVLTGANTYSGTTQATGAVVFGPSSRPANSSLSVSGGYIGQQLTASTSGTAAAVTGFLSQFSSAQGGGYLGFDSGSSVTVTDLDLTAINSTLGVATVSSLHIAGNYVPASNGDYRFAGYAGGQLTVDSTLTGSRALIVGSTANSATMASTANGVQMSGVTLTGDNSGLSGPVTLNGGNLIVGNDHALGTGNVTVTSGVANPTTGVRPGLLTSTSATVANAIAVNSDLNVGGSYSLTLSGALSGVGELYKIGGGTLTLSGVNTTTGGTYLQGGSVIFATGASVGSGPLEFGLIPSSATFQDNSTVNGIEADLSSDVINLSGGKTLTVNQTFDTTFQGLFAGSTAGLTFQGTRTLQLSGASTFSGPVAIQGGMTVLAANNAAFGNSSNVVTVTNSKIATASGITVANPVTLNNSSVGGSGTFNNGPTAFNFNAGNTIAPGLKGTGTLTLASTTAMVLGGGGVYEWDLLDANVTTGSWDKVVVNGTVNIAANATTPFNFKLATIAPDGTSGFAANFDPTHAYSWTVLTATSLTGFTGSNQFAIDTSLFKNQLGVGSFSIGTIGNSLVVNFTPVPEPSTYVLMLAGLGMTGLAIRRRRRSG